MKHASMESISPFAVSLETIFTLSWSVVLPVAVRPLLFYGFRSTDLIDVTICEAILRHELSRVTQEVSVRVAASR